MIYDRKRVAIQKPSVFVISLQEDVMHRNLTVKEVLWYQAELRLPGHVPKKQREQKVKQVLANLG